MKKIAINGFGRIGRTFLRVLLADPQAVKQLAVVAINIGDSKPEIMAHLFAYDSVLGRYPGIVKLHNNTLIINDQSIELLSTKDPLTLPWKKMGIDWVVECTGHFTDGTAAKAHQAAGAAKVLISAPAEHEDITIIPGVNDTAYDPARHSIISLGSCTTNCFAPMVKVINEEWGIVNGLMTTVHAYTNDQVLVDGEHKDPRRARAAALNIIPTKTGAEKTIIKLYPALAGALKATSLRVPVAVVSLVDFTVVLKKTATAETINATFKKHAQGSLKGILDYTDLPLVSSDYAQHPASCIIDGQLTQSVGSTIKVFGWYDNEYGYSSRLKDFLLHNR